MRDLGRVHCLLLGGSFARVDQVGFLLAVDDYGIKIPEYTAVSVGALNAPGYIESGSRGLSLLWRSIEEKGSKYIFDFWKLRTLWRAIRRKPYILDNSGIKELTANLDAAKIIKAAVKSDENRNPSILNVVTYNEETRDTEIFSTSHSDVQERPELLSQAILAAVSIRGVFLPVPIERRPGKRIWYSDAGSYGLKPLFDAGADTVLVFRSRTPSHKVAKRSWWAQNLLDNQDRVANILLDDIIASYRGRAIDFRLEQGAGTLTATYFNKGDISKTIDLARERGREILSKL